VKRDFEPGFYVEHFIKDLGIALEEAQGMNLTLPGLTLARQVYDHVREDGFDRKGTTALMMTLERMNGIGAP
jgi:3-hydroxyisobutyrate dehydrogenase